MLAELFGPKDLSSMKDCRIYRQARDGFIRRERRNVRKL
jgi:hypothetical protein